MHDHMQINEAIKQLLLVPSDSKHYQEAHAQAFDMVYGAEFAESSNTRAAFIVAVSCCLDENGKFLQFQLADQLKLDNFLFSSFGCQGVLSTPLSISVRKVLLQSLMLNTIKEEVARLLSANAGHGFFARRERYQGLVESLIDILTGLKSDDSYGAQTSKA